MDPGKMLEELFNSLNLPFIDRRERVEKHTIIHIDITSYVMGELINTSIQRMIDVEKDEEPHIAITQKALFSNLDNCVILDELMLKETLPILNKFYEEIKSDET